MIVFVGKRGKRVLILPGKSQFSDLVIFVSLQFLCRRVTDYRADGFGWMKLRKKITILTQEVLDLEGLNEYDGAVRQVV